MVGPRVFTLEEANALVPELLAAFDRIESRREALRRLKIKLHALEMIWGSELEDESCPDHAEGAALIDQLQEAEQEVAAIVQGLLELGATVKDIHRGLVDLYHVRDGRLVLLCWQRGEEAFEAWHHVDTGFADRRPV